MLRARWGGGGRGRATREAERAEDRGDDLGLLDRGDHAHATAAGRALEHVAYEDALLERGPREPPRARRSRYRRVGSGDERVGVARSTGARASVPSGSASLTSSWARSRARSRSKRTHEAVDLRLDEFTLWVYRVRSMIFRVEIARLAEKQLRKLPRHIVDNLLIWVAAVEHDGLEEVRKLPATTMSR